MIRIISALLLTLSTACALAQQAKSIELADNAPDRHIVVPGDTLWAISAQFLKEPYRWPEIWRMNKDQIKNPHWIYPGQVVILDRSGTQPQLRLGQTNKLEPKIYSEDESLAIPSIPQQVIEPFLSRPLVVDEDGLRNAPKIVALEEDRVYLGPGGRGYVSGMKEDSKIWQIYRKAKPVLDPETQEVLGYEAVYVGTAKQLAKGEPATIEIISAKEEIGLTDRLAPAGRPEIVSYVPHAPSKAINGQVAAIYGGVNQAGRNSIVTLNRGTRDGLEVGHVLALYRNGGNVTYREDDRKTEYKLPAERYGLLFVFRTFDRISYGLVMNVTRPVVVSDFVRTP